MLHDFLASNRDDLIDRCNSKAALRHSTAGFAGAELARGVPRLLDVLAATLRARDASAHTPSVAAERPDNVALATPAIAATAARHGRELLRQGFPIEEVVYCYGDLCQAIADLAIAHGAPIRVEEFRTLNHCLDHAIADALREFARERDRRVTDGAARALHERLGSFAHELRNHLHTATLALAAIRAGAVAPAGATAAVMERSMGGMRNLIDRALADVRVTAELPARHRVVVLADFIAELCSSAALEAKALDCRLIVAPVDAALAVHADSDLLLAAVGNLLQNAFKFTRSRTAVSLNVHAGAERVLIEVADRCGGLPAGDVERLFLPFAQSGADRSGVGLGLSICRRSVEGNGGVLRVRDVPGTGCVFTIDLPRHTLAQTGT